MKQANSYMQYRRAQVDWALWQSFAGEGPKSKISSSFKVRLSKLLELDRQATHAAHSKLLFAFVEEGKPGRGGELAFTAFDTFCLHVALDLLDMGFKQAEVVAVLHYTRPAFLKHFNRILDADVPPTADLLSPDDFPQLPIGLQGEADPKYFAVLSRVEPLQLSKRAAKRVTDMSHIAKPEFFAGLVALADSIHQRDHDDRKFIILEIGSMVRRLVKTLEDVPDLGRGRAR